MIVSAVTVFLHSSANCFLIIAVIYAVLKEYIAGVPEKPEKLTKNGPETDQSYSFRQSILFYPGMHSRSPDSSPA